MTNQHPLDDQQGHDLPVPVPAVNDTDTDLHPLLKNTKDDPDFHPDSQPLTTADVHARGLIGPNKHAQSQVLPDPDPDADPSKTNPKDIPDQRSPADAIPERMTADQYFSRQADIPLQLPPFISRAIDHENPRVKQRAEKACMFLEALLLTTSVTEALRASGLPMATVYTWRDAHPDFKASWDAAVELGFQAARAESLRRGRDGVVEPVYQKGCLMGYVRKYSDNLLMFSLKARYPDEYREKQTQQESGNTIHYHIHGIDRGALPDPIDQAKDVTDGTNVEPLDGDGQKPQ